MVDHVHKWAPYSREIRGQRCTVSGCWAMLSDKGSVIDHTPRTQDPKPAANPAPDPAQVPDAEPAPAPAPAATADETHRDVYQDSAHVRALRRAIGTGGPLIREHVRSAIQDHDEHRRERIAAKESLERTRDELATVRSAGDAALGVADSLKKRLAEANERLERVLFYLAKPTVWNVSRAIRAARGEDVGPPAPSPEGTPQPFAMPIPAVVESPREAAPTVIVRVALSGEALRDLLSRTRQLSSIEIETCQQHGKYTLSTVEHPKPQEPTP